MCRGLLLVKDIYPLGRTRLRLPTYRGIRPLDDSPPSQVRDVLVVVPDLPKEGLGVLGDLGGGAVESRSQGEFEQPAVTEVRADIRMLHLNAQRIRLGVGMVRIKRSLQSFVGPDTADVRLDEHLFPLGSGAPGEDARNLGAQRLVIGLPRLSSREAAIGQEVAPLHGAAEGLPLVLEQTTQEHPPFPAAVETVQS